MHSNETGLPYYIDNWRSDPNLVYLNGAAFLQPADRTFGSMQRNAVAWPHTQNVDLAPNKPFKIAGERLQVDLHWKIINLFNWLNWNVPTLLSLQNANNLKMTNYWTTAPRTMQVGARVAW